MILYSCKLLIEELSVGIGLSSFFTVSFVSCDEEPVSECTTDKEDSEKNPEKGVRVSFTLFTSSCFSSSSSFSSCGSFIFFKVHGVFDLLKLVQKVELS